MDFEAKVEDIISRTHDVKSFRFARPASLSYKAGQFMFVTIKVDGETMRKHFTISSSPTEKDFLEFTKKLTGHPFSNALDTLKIGDSVRINAPFGNFTFEGEFKRIGLLSGGIGITPLRSICKFCTDLRLDTKVTLLYSNRTEGDIAFKQELEEMERQNKNIKVVFTVTESGTSWAGYSGRIDAGMIQREVDDCVQTVFYICGPPGMVEAIEDLLKGLGVPRENVKRESFLGY